MVIAGEDFDMTMKQALRTFFPNGCGYDQERADRLVAWLERCGYQIVPAEQSNTAAGPGGKILEFPTKRRVRKQAVA